MRDLVRLDVEDAQAQYARSTAVIVQGIANRERLRTDGDNMIDDLTESLCYSLVKDPVSGDTVWILLCHSLIGKHLSQML
jgi:hypothetical protein